MAIDDERSDGTDRVADSDLAGDRQPEQARPQNEKRDSKTAASQKITPAQRPAPKTDGERYSAWAKRQKEQRESLFRELLPKLAGQGRDAFAKAMGISHRTLTKLEKSTGLYIRPLQIASRKAIREEEPAPTEQGPTWLEGWSILRLFDELARYFRGRSANRKTWVAWRVFLAAAFGEPIALLDADRSAVGCDGQPLNIREDDGSLRVPVEVPDYPPIDAGDLPRGAANLPGSSRWQTIFEICTGRKAWPVRQARMVALIVGRRGGKSYITAMIGLYLALCRRYELNLGTRGMVVILAKDREQAGVIRGYILSFLRTPLLAPFLVGEPTQKLIELTNGITIEVRAVNESSTRAYTIVAALLDEIAFWPTDDRSARQDRKVIDAMQPAMLGVDDTMTVMLSSPYATRGELYETWREHFGKEEDLETLVWQADTLSMRPDDDPKLLSWIRRAYDRDPDSAKAEYGADFRSDLEALFSRVAVEAVCAPGVIQRPYDASKSYRAFVDPSGGMGDSAVLAIVHDEMRGDKQIAVLDGYWEVVGKHKPSDAVKLHASVAKDYGCSVVVGDAYSGAWVRNEFEKYGIAYELSPMTKSELYLELVAMLNSGLVELLDPRHHRVLVNQLINLERSTGRTGRDSVDHPTGAHDDVANAAAGALVLRQEEVFQDVVW